MPEIIETTVYHLDELTDPAKDKARAWYRDGVASEDWYEFVFEDFETIASLLGLELKTQTIRLYGGGTRQQPCLYFRGFWSQGDGACFEGFYRYKAGARQAILSHAPTETELHAIADRLQNIQRRNFYRVTADVTHRGRYCHEYSMDIEVTRGGRPAVAAADEEGIAEATRDLARWLYRQLEREYEYQTSDEVIDEAIMANGYTFTLDGRRFG
ncbi:antitoxin of toxin-antitoxin stability system [Acidocella sp.]|uniref:antitoxin of toxin-antitoxin stability system n=1 Tax=Acidocella sp. TaxID=50710 RepID=UPI0026030E16|nr:antitoxin of toxin-antitoxin stability system [Acidocella sp.]